MEQLYWNIGLTQLVTTSYRIELDMEALLSGSFSNQGDADRVRGMLRRALDDDGLGIGVWTEGEEIHLAYLITVLVGRKRDCSSR